MATKISFGNQLDKYCLHEIIGEGAFGKVCRATRVEDKKEFAIKCLKIKNIKNSNMVQTVRKEVQVMKKIPHHKHCVNMIEVLQSDSYVFIVVELVKGGQLFDIIQNSPQKRLSEEVAREYFKQIICGLEFLHGQKIVHRDLKLENILVHEDGYVMISDFGLSGTRKQVKNDRELKDVAGSPNYVAPEILSGRGYDGYAADIWSCGVILYALIAGFLPFEDDDFKKLFEKIVNCDITFPKYFTTAAVHLLAKIFVVDPKERITLEEIKKHAFYLGISVTMRYDEKTASNLRFSLSADSIPTGSNRGSEEEVFSIPEFNNDLSVPIPPISVGKTVSRASTDYGDDPKQEDPAKNTPTEKLTFFDLMGSKFNKMMTNVLKRDSSNAGTDPNLPLVDDAIDTRLRSRSVPQKSVTEKPKKISKSGLTVRGTKHMTYN